ncbi:hypothetical protein GGF31_005486 [Allomyces arbusculus]|nr:hypothetical protein GGF31_005486 [Allomyces arbusculus]
MAHVYLDEQHALLDPSLRLALLLQAQEAFGPGDHYDFPDADATLVNGVLGGDADQHAANAASLQLIQDMFLADLAMTQEEEQLRRDHALAHRLASLDEDDVDERDYARVANPMPIVRADDLPLYIPPPAPVVGECTVCAEGLHIVPGTGGTVLPAPAAANGAAANGAVAAAAGNKHAHGVLFPTCEHEYCAGCLLSWIESTVNDRTLKFPTTCAHDGCTAVLTGEHARKLLAGNAHRRLREKYLTRDLEASGRAVYCPRRTCGAMVVINNLTQLQAMPDPLVECSRCHRGFCFRCRVVDHYPLSCERYQALPEHERDPEDVALHRLAQQNQWKRCPACRAVVERKVGCNFMKCLCGAGWCYRCGVKYINLEATAEHQHGRPGCNCLLFDVPDEPAPVVALPQHRAGVAIAQALRHVNRAPGYQFNFNHRQQQQPQHVYNNGHAGHYHYDDESDYDSDEQSDHDQFDDFYGHNHDWYSDDGGEVMEEDRAPPRWPRTQTGRRVMACGRGEVMHPDEQGRRLPAWLVNSYLNCQCHYCGQEFNTWLALVNHFHTTNAHSVYMCCNRTFMDENGYLNHLDNVHGGHVQNW